MFSNVSDVVEAWITDRKLSRRNLAFLRTVFQQMTDYLPPSRHLQVADGLCCEELDLPRGSSWLEVVASLLDHLEPRPSAPCRLEEAMELLDEGVREMLEEDYYNRLEDGTPGSEGYAVPAGI